MPQLCPSALLLSMLLVIISTDSASPHVFANFVFGMKTAGGHNLNLLPGGIVNYYWYSSFLFFLKVVQLILMLKSLAGGALVYKTKMQLV